MNHELRVAPSGAGYCTYGDWYCLGYMTDIIESYQRHRDDLDRERREEIAAAFGKEAK